MASPNIAPRMRLQTLTLAVLLALAAFAWLAVLWQARMAGGAMGLTMGLNAPLFLALWIVMMVAMMFPAAVPMVQMLQRIADGKRLQRQASPPAWVFVVGYLIVWALFGALAYAAATAIDHLAGQSMFLMASGPRLGGLVLVLAGVYQLTPLKRACLAKCRSPVSFLLTSWHDGGAGALRMGMEHGGFCLGCCWAMMVVLFVVGVMSLPWMALLSVAIFIEKNLPLERASTAALAGLFMAVGVTLAANPSMLQRIAL
jgi:predicted metal-binding membrane protein